MGNSRCCSASQACALADKLLSRAWAPLCRLQVLRECILRGLTVALHLQAVLQQAWALQSSVLSSLQLPAVQSAADAVRAFRAACSAQAAGAAPQAPALAPAASVRSPPPEPAVEVQQPPSAR